jgi:hypothetical protein
MYYFVITCYKKLYQDALSYNAGLSDHQDEVMFSFLIILLRLPSALPYIYIPCRPALSAMHQLLIKVIQSESLLTLHLERRG